LKLVRDSTLFRSMDVERLERDEILAIPVYQIVIDRINSLVVILVKNGSISKSIVRVFSQYNSMFYFILIANSN
jgi:hypothetical protein